jgi:hypothetical protein
MYFSVIVSKCAYPDADYIMDYVEEENVEKIFRKQDGDYMLIYASTNTTIENFRIPFMFLYSQILPFK